MNKEQLVKCLRECPGRVSCNGCPCVSYCSGTFEKEAIDMIEFLYAQLKQVTRERDAMYFDFRSLAIGFGDGCSYCRFCEWEGVKGTCMRPEIIAEETGEEVEDGTLICKWEWRGMCADNGGVKNGG